MRTLSRRAALALALVAPAMPSAVGRRAGAVDAPEAGAAAQDEARRQVQASLAEHGVALDLEAGTLAFPVRVGVRDHLLEHLLTGPAGETHEALFTTQVSPTVLNAGLLLLGLEPGRNAAWVGRESAGGVTSAEVLLPRGDGVCIQLAWMQGEERYLYRAEDLIVNLRTGHAMERRPWVYLGSKTIWRDNLSATDRRMEPVFAAEVLQDLINIPFFEEGHTLVTAALEDCADQNVWVANAPLVPEARTAVTMVVSRAPLERLPEAVRAALPRVAPAALRSEVPRSAESIGRARPTDGAGSVRPGDVPSGAAGASGSEAADEDG